MSKETTTTTKLLLKSKSTTTEQRILSILLLIGLIIITTKMSMSMSSSTTTKATTTTATTTAAAAFAINNNDNNNNEEKNGSNNNKKKNEKSTNNNNNNSNSNNNINWIVRKSNLDDRFEVNKLLKSSYENLLIDDYPSNILDIVLPSMCTAQDDLLESGTWYVVEHPTTHELVGCGGWTPFLPLSKKMKIMKMESLTKETKDKDIKDDDDDESNNTNSNNNNNYPNLRHFGTDPNYKRQGIGKAIWNQCWNDIILEYYNTNTKEPPKTMEVISTITAVPFYKSLGFTKISDMSIPFPITATTTGESNSSSSSSPPATDNNICDFPCILMRREIGCGGML